MGVSTRNMCSFRQEKAIGAEMVIQNDRDAPILAILGNENTNKKNWTRLRKGRSFGSKIKSLIHTLVTGGKSLPRN